MLQAVAKSGVSVDELMCICVEQSNITVWYWNKDNDDFLFTLEIQKKTAVSNIMMITKINNNGWGKHKKATKSLW